jgi:RNA polymerase-binding transcription factor DksA
MMTMASEARTRLQKRREALGRLLGKQHPSSRDALAEELVETDAALERIEQGTFGRCETCGGAIGKQRLFAMPASRFCIHCAATGKIVR